MSYFLKGDEDARNQAQFDSDVRAFYDKHQADIKQMEQEYMREISPLVSLDSHGKRVAVVWSTPVIDGILGYIARVSNPDNQNNPSVAGLLTSMLNEGHWSPFTMANICVEINTTRDISRQLLRHSSIHPQEFSQRYQNVGKLPPVPTRECRLQDTKNRQASIRLPDPNYQSKEEEDLAEWWNEMQIEVQENTQAIYQEALSKGIAKEQARVLLPEGLTATRLYMNGNIRSWLTFLLQRLHWTTQREAQDVAKDVEALLKELCPTVMQAFKDCKAYKGLEASGIGEKPDYL